MASGMDARTGNHGGGNKVAVIDREKVQPYYLYSSLDQGGFPKAKGLLPSKSPRALGHSAVPPTPRGPKAMFPLQSSPSQTSGIQLFLEATLQLLVGTASWLLHSGMSLAFGFLDLYSCGPLDSLPGSNSERPPSPQRNLSHCPAQA